MTVETLKTHTLQLYKPVKKSVLRQGDVSLLQRLLEQPIDAI